MVLHHPGGSLLTHGYDRRPYLGHFLVRTSRPSDAQESIDGMSSPFSHLPSHERPRAK